MEVVDTLIISDIHLGTHICRSQILLKTLKTYQNRNKYLFNRLILLGDIFEDLNFNRFDEYEWAFLSYLRELSDPKNKVNVIWVLGNHDYEPLITASRIIGVEVFEEYTWTYDGKKYLAIHGDQFDRFLINNAFISKLAIKLFLLIQKIDSKHKIISRYLDRFSTKWLQLSTKVKRGAIEYARKKHVDTIFCGHVHHAELFEDTITYGNTGSWVQIPSSYIAIGKNGTNLIYVD